MFVNELDGRWTIVIFHPSDHSHSSPHQGAGDDMLCMLFHLQWYQTFSVKLFSASQLHSVEDVPWARAIMKTVTSCFVLVVLTNSRRSQNRQLATRLEHINALHFPIIGTTHLDINGTKNTTRSSWCLIDFLNLHFLPSQLPLLSA